MPFRFYAKSYSVPYLLIKIKNNNHLLLETNKQTKKKKISNIFTMHFDIKQKTIYHQCHLTIVLLSPKYQISIFVLPHP